MHVAASPQAIELVRAAGSRLFVWPARTLGCQPMIYLNASAERPSGETFRRAPFSSFELWVGSHGPWPDELELDVSRGRLRALWDGAAWKLHD